LENRNLSKMGAGRDSVRREGKQKRVFSDAEFAFLSKILDILPVGIFLIDSHFQVAFVNSTLERYFGISRAETLGKNKRELVKEKIKNLFENGEEFCHRVIATYDNNTYIEHFTCHLLGAPGREERWLEHRSQPIKEGPLAGGRAELYFDVTERVLMEKELDWLSGQLITLQEKERERLARDLHDSLGQSIIGQKLMLESLLESISSKKVVLKDIRPKLKEVISEVERISHEVKRISFDLMPSVLSSLGLQDALEWITEQFSSLCGLRVNLEIFGLKENRLPPGIEVALFRIFQEALNNISKHANATAVKIKLSYVHPMVIAVISDNGKGFAAENNNIQGLGIKCMRRRVQELGGSFQLHSELGKGTTIRVEVPLEGGGAFNGKNKNSGS